MDAQTLFRQGVQAIREHKDVAEGRQLLLRALDQDPNNDQAWLWLTRTVPDAATRLQYVERALALNPGNEAAQKLKAQMVGALDAPTGARAVIRPIMPKTLDVPASPEEKERIAQLMERGDSYAAAGDMEAAIGQWVEVLKIRVDHEQALRNAVGHLWKLGFHDDARELVGRAVDAGTRVPSLIITAIDMAERARDVAVAERLRQQVAAQPGADEHMLVTIADYYVRRFHPEQAEAFLVAALETNPHYQQVMMRLGDLLTEQQRTAEAMAYYDRAVRAGGRSKAGRAADKKLAAYVPVMTDRERGSWLLAARETLGIGLIFLTLAVQDAGLSLLEMGPRRWAGVALSLLGAYLVITATSSPQQKPIVGWLGGTVPARREREAGVAQPRNRPGQAAQDPTELPILPPSVRYLFGAVGVIVLAVAFVMVLHQALELVTHDPPPYLPWSE